MRVFVINGPNLNLLGTREPEIYGFDTLSDIEERCQDVAKARDLEVMFMQSNYEGQIVSWIQQAIEEADAIIINAGAYTHTSVAIHDAIKAYPGFTVELHISNPHTREPFRHHSYVSLAADVVVAGIGANGYEYTLKQLPKYLEST